MTKTILQEKCTVCARTSHTLFETVNETQRKRVMSCGHVITTELKVKKSFDFTWDEGRKKPHPFQIETMEKARDADFRFGIFHQMGLGKTICALGCIREYMQDLMPVGIFCKSSLALNWMREIAAVCGLKYPFLPYLVNDGKDVLDTKMFPLTIISLDMLRQFENINQFNFKTLIIDECQLIKNPSAKRTQLVRKIAANAKHVLALSGTPTKNHAGEYFTILNILNPQMFYQYEAYLRQWVHVDYRNRPRGIKYPAEFKEATKSFIIRYERQEVEQQLPNIDRQYKFFEMSDEVKQAYDVQQKKFDDAYDEYETLSGAKKAEQWTNVLAYMAIMRQIVGIAKAQPGKGPIAELIEDFTEQNPDEKLAVFMHHHAAANLVYNQLVDHARDNEMLEPINMVGVNGFERGLRGELFFKNPDYKFLVGTTLASGEGLNLQSCGYCIIGEREWNPANEEQAECRFVRLGSKHPKVVAIYPIATGTIDEFMTQLVEQKRLNQKATLSGEEVYNWEETELLQELAGIIRKNGRSSLWRAA